MAIKLHFLQKGNFTKKIIKEKSIKTILFLSAISAIIVIFSIIFFLLRDAYPIFQTAGYGSILSGVKWNPTGEPPSYGAFSLIVGTLLVTIGAMVIAIPLSLGSAIFISEIASPRMKSIIKPAIELLAGIPSVVLWFFWINSTYNLA